MSRMSAQLVVSLLDGVSGPAAKAKTSLTALQRAERNVQLARSNSRLSRTQVAEERLLAAREADVAARRDRWAAGLRNSAAAVAAGLWATSKVTAVAADFEEAMFNIQKKSGATAQQMANLKRELLSLGDEVPASLEELQAAFERGAAAGIPLDDLKEYAKLTTQVADAWDMSAESVANAFAGFESGLGIDRSDLEPLADLINYLADSGIADESGIVDFLDRAGASLRNFGMSPQEIAAFGAAMQNLKMAPEIAARAMDTLSGKLLAPENLSKKSRMALKEIVGDLEEFQKLVNSDATAGLMSFFEKLEGMSGQRRVSLLGALMGEGFDDEVARIVSGLDEVKENLALIQNENEYKGSIAGLSEKRLDLLNSKVKLLKNAIQEAGIALGDWASPASGAVTDWVTDQLNDMSAFSAGRRKLEESGRSEGEYQDIFIDERRKLFPDENWWTSQTEGVKAFRAAVRALGEGEIDNVLQPLRRYERMLGMDGPKRSRSPYVETGEPPTPRARPKSRAEMTEAEWLAAAYGAGRHRNYGAGGQRYVAPQAGMPNFDPDEFERKLKSGGFEAGNQIAEGGTQAGQNAAATLTAQASSIGAAIGESIARAVRAAVSNLSVNVQGGAPARTVGQQVRTASEGQAVDFGGRR